MTFICFSTGIERMAFIWAMQLTPDQKYGTRLMKRNVLTPIKIEVKVYRGHIQVTDPENIHSGRLQINQPSL